MLGKIAVSVLALILVPWLITVSLARIAGMMAAVQDKPPSALSGLEPIIKKYAVALSPVVMIELTFYFAYWIFSVKLLLALAIVFMITAVIIFIAFWVSVSQN